LPFLIFLSPLNENLACQKFLMFFFQQWFEIQKIYLEGFSIVRGWITPITLLKTWQGWLVLCLFRLQILADQMNTFRLLRIWIKMIDKINTKLNLLTTTAWNLFYALCWLKQVYT
jgi:hypothetical protein